jgi:3-hydroxyisobutyrate dehydrogenase-like beta-hydroxyacid dehydrogenase
VSGSKKPAIDGQLIILAAGDEGLFKDCAAAFDIMVRAKQGQSKGQGRGRESQHHSPHKQ